MKKLVMISLSALFLLLIAPAKVHSSSGHDPVTDKLTAQTEVGFLVGRLEEINAMDVTMLSSSERRELRKEVREIKKNLNAYSGGGIYISVGAAILIVLLLILLL